MALARPGIQPKTSLPTGAVVEIRVVKPFNVDTVVELRAGEEVGVGRSRKNRLAFSGEETLSSYHAAVEVDSCGAVHVVDKSTNGTYLEGVRVEKGTPVPLPLLPSSGEESSTPATLSLCASDLDAAPVILSLTLLRPPTCPPTSSTTTSKPPPPHPASGTDPAPTPGKQTTTENSGHHRVLGKGSFATVYAGTHRGKEVAIKRAWRDKFEDQVVASAVKHGRTVPKIDHEWTLMSQLKDPHIVRALEVFQDKQAFSMVMELAQHGDLAAFQRAHPVPPLFIPYYAAASIYQVGQALSYLHHKMKIVHRDLKLSNVLVFADDSVSPRNWKIKVADFGMSVQLSSRVQKLYTLCGTPAYAAPEMVGNKGYGTSVDMWSLGVMAFQLFIGDSPFSGSKRLLFHQIQHGLYDIPPSLSKGPRSLISRLLKVDTSTRLRARHISSHPWLAAVVKGRQTITTATTAATTITTIPVTMGMKGSTPVKVRGMKSECGLTRLPDKVVVYMAQYLGSAQALVALSTTCKAVWKALRSAPQVWACVALRAHAELVERLAIPETAVAQFRSLVGQSSSCSRLGRVVTLLAGWEGTVRGVEAGLETICNRCVMVDARSALRILVPAVFAASSSNPDTNGVPYALSLWSGDRLPDSTPGGWYHGCGLVPSRRLDTFLVRGREEEGEFWLDEMNAVLAGLSAWIGEAGRVTTLEDVSGGDGGVDAVGALVNV